MKDQEVTEADVVARDGHGVGAGLSGGGGSLATRLGSLGVLDAVLAFMVQDTVSKLVQALAEGVVVAWG